MTPDLLRMIASHHDLSNVTIYETEKQISAENEIIFYSHITALVPHCSKLLYCVRLFFFLQIATFYFFLFYYFLFINLSFENGHNAIFIFMFLYTFYVWILLFYDGPKNTNFHSLTMTIYYY